jgi:formylglycine-generating enzyme required for sulfatase activity
MFLFFYRYSSAYCQLNNDKGLIKIQDTSTTGSTGFCGWPALKSQRFGTYTDSSKLSVIRLANSSEIFPDSALYFRCRKVAQEIMNGMIYLPQGEFWQGCKMEDDIECDHRAFAEKPIHKVAVNSFFMAGAEVTQRQWRAVMGYNPSKNAGCDDCPVERVSWNEVQGFLGILNYATGIFFALPTESEWEYAAKITDSSSVWKKGDTTALKEMGWFYQNSGGKTHTVATKMPGNMEIYDLHGNVREWCADLYAGYPGKNKNSLPMDAGLRSVRGGGWYDEFRKCRSSFRFYQNSDEKSEFVGFRLVLH